MPTIQVTIPSAPHQYVIEPRVLSACGRFVRDLSDHERVVVCLDEAIADTHAPRAIDSLRESGFDVLTLPIEAREEAKTLEQVHRMYRTMLEARVDRHTPMIAVGGGVVGDTVGFAASTFLRGVPLIQCPTTLLAMVDASIGGKTAVNFELPDGGLGKNLIGSFYQPLLVLADPETLTTLDRRELRSGLAECVKHGVIADPALLSSLAEHAEKLLAADTSILIDLIAQSVQVKVDIVSRDEQENGVRAVLNLGHTFAHAIETIPSLDLRHGEAVAIGLIAACECAVLTKRLRADRRDMVRDLLTLLGLPTALPSPRPIPELLVRMGFDKKSARGRMRLILPIEFGEVEIVDDPPIDAVRKAWSAVGASG